MGSWVLHHVFQSLQWRHNEPDCVINHQPHDCLLNRLLRHRSKKTSKLRVTGLCVGNSPGPVNSPHKGPVTRKMFPFDDVFMWFWFISMVLSYSNYWRFLPLQLFPSGIILRLYCCMRFIFNICVPSIQLLSGITPKIYLFCHRSHNWLQMTYFTDACL